ncbi:MAG: polyprenyl synthetase family protein [Bacteroidales bacterium]|nr:polyprenyl synthetase family protein [Bacteroidales bacterium]
MKQLKEYLSDVEYTFAQANFSTQPPSLYDPIDYSMHIGGKRLRPTLLLIANDMFEGNTDKAMPAAIGIELFHNFTLLHDDLMDCSPLRRGQPTVYRKWGNNTAILSGDTMFALAWQHMLQVQSPNLMQALQCFNQTAIEVCEGQQYDMDFEQRADVSIDQYLMMTHKKTAALLVGALKIGALLAQAPADDIAHLETFGHHFGLAFQLQDDLLDAYGDTPQFGKATGQDIIDCKKTYLPLRSLELATGADMRNTLLKLMDKQHPLSAQQRVQQTMQIYNSLDIASHTRHAIAHHFDQAAKALQHINLPETHKEPLHQLLLTLHDRKK